MSVTHRVEPLSFVDCTTLKLHFLLKDSAIISGFTLNVVVVLLSELSLDIARTDCLVSHGCHFVVLHLHLLCIVDLLSFEVSL